MTDKEVISKINQITTQHYEGLITDRECLNRIIDLAISNLLEKK